MESKLTAFQRIGMNVFMNGINDLYPDAEWIITPNSVSGTYGKSECETIIRSKVENDNLMICVSRDNDATGEIVTAKHSNLEIDVDTSVPEDERKNILELLNTDRVLIKSLSLVSNSVFNNPGSLEVEMLDDSAVIQLEDTTIDKIVYHENKGKLLLSVYTEDGASESAVDKVINSAVNSNVYEYIDEIQWVQK
jgi:hypothetical protein